MQKQFLCYMKNKLYIVIQVWQRKDMKKSKIWVLLIMLCLSTILYAQGNYVPGYIVTNQQDTLVGWIDYRTDAKNALECNFKKDAMSKKQTYLPGSIFGYRLINEGKFYISKNITINNISQIVFVEYLVQGIVNLYFYVDSKNPLWTPEYYLFEDETGKMTVITKKPDQYVTNDNGVTHIKTDNSYIEIIRHLFQSSDATIKDIDHLQFTQQSIIEITKDYHKQMCTTGEDCIVFTGTPDSHYTWFKFSVYAGCQIYYDLSTGDAWSPLIGGRMNVIAPRFSKYMGFQLDLSVSRISEKYNGIDGKEYKYSAILIPLKFGFKYTFGKYKLRPSVELGSVFHSYVNEKTDEPFNIGNGNETSAFSGNFGSYACFGLDYVLKNNHAIIFGASIDETPPLTMGLFQFKFGYTW